MRHYSRSILLAVISMSAVMLPVKANEAIQFNSHFLKKIMGQEHVDLSLFEYANYILPGRYLTDIYVNHQYVEQLDLTFDVPADPINTGPIEARTKNAVPCLTLGMLSRWGVDIGKVSAWEIMPDNVCVDLTTAVPYSTIKFDLSQHRLTVMVPQAMMHKRVQYEVAPALWSDGINAARVNYQWLLTRNRYGDSNHSNITGMLESGVNLGSWRIRQRANYRLQTHQRHWQTAETNVTRDLQAWQSSLILGDIFTPGEIFPGVGLRGIQIIPNQAMLPYSQQGYAPVIRGLAQTNATVTIKQNGYTIYTALVAPGPFVIDDLAPTSEQNDFEVIVTEADGRVTRTMQSYANLPMQLRAGANRFQIAIGQYRNQKNNLQPWLWQGTLASGLNSQTTTYIGMQVSDKYQNVIGGVVTGLGAYGSAALDISHAQYKFQEDTQYHGQAVRFQYAKLYMPTKTSMQFSAHYYLSPDFRTFSESVVSLSDRQHQPFRTRLEYRLSQPLGTGQLNAQWQITHHQSGVQKNQIQVGYYGRFNKINYGIDYTHQLAQPDHAPYHHADRRLSLSLSISLDNFLHSRHSAALNYFASSDANRGTSYTLGASGSLTGNNPVSYSVSQTQSSSEGKVNNLGVQLQSTYANVALNYSQGIDYHTQHASLAGGMIAHRGGITLSPPLAETVTLISVPGASGVRLAEQNQIKTDIFGYAVLPSLVPYRKNRITLQTEDLDNDIEVTQSIAEVVPTKGAIAFAEYPTRQGYKILLVVKDQHNKSLPLGAQVKNQQGHELGVVGMHGQIYLAGALAADHLMITSGKQQLALCHLKYALSPTDLDNYKKISQLSVFKINSVCLEN